jgi:hypothetical protein
MDSKDARESADIGARTGIKYNLIVFNLGVIGAITSYALTNLQTKPEGNLPLGVAPLLAVPPISAILFYLWCHHGLVIRLGRPSRAGVRTRVGLQEPCEWGREIRTSFTVSVISNFCVLPFCVFLLYLWWSGIHQNIMEFVVMGASLLAIAYFLLPRPAKRLLWLRAVLFFGALLLLVWCWQGGIPSWGIEWGLAILAILFLVYDSVSRSCYCPCRLSRCPIAIFIFIAIGILLLAVSCHIHWRHVGMAEVLGVLLPLLFLVLALATVSRFRIWRYFYWLCLGLVMVHAACGLYVVRQDHNANAHRTRETGQVACRTPSIWRLLCEQPPVSEPVASSDTSSHAHDSVPISLRSLFEVVLGFAPFFGLPTYMAWFFAEYYIDREKLIGEATAAYWVLC